MSKLKILFNMDALTTFFGDRFSKKREKASGPTHELVIVEQSYDLCKELAGRFPEALVLNEDISDESFINEERISNLDLIVAATNRQEFNVITALYLKSRGVSRAAASVSGAGYAKIARDLGVDVVIPAKQVLADSIISALMGNEVKRLRRIGDGTIGIMEVEVSPESLVAGKPIMAFHVAAGALVLLVSRNKAEAGASGAESNTVRESFIPRGDYVFIPGDHVIIISKNGSEEEIEKYFLAEQEGES
jgi:trk system potassium uptake protein TrkA